MPTLTIPVAPVGKPRMTQRDKWRKRPAVVRYRQFCDTVRAYADLHRFTLPPAGARLVFHIPMPPSWSRKRRAAMDGQPHQQKPDLDNLIKAIADALLGDDSVIWQVSAEKRWATSGRVEIYTGAEEQAA